MNRDKTVWIQLLETVGFPAAVALFLLTQYEPRLDHLEVLAQQQISALDQVADRCGQTIVTPRP